MNIGKKILLMSISMVSVGLLSSHANAYQPLYGNDYANINTYGVNEDDFKKDNIIRRDGNHTSVNIPKPKGKVDINILGNKRTINLDNDEEKRLNKRKRYFTIQKRKKAQRMEEQRKIAVIKEKQEAEKMRLDALKEAEKSKKMEEEARIKALQTHKQSEQFRRYNEGNSMNNGISSGIVPSTRPLGLPQ